MKVQSGIAFVVAAIAALASELSKQPLPHTVSGHESCFLICGTAIFVLAFPDRGNYSAAQLAIAVRPAA